MKKESIFISVIIISMIFKMLPLFSFPVRDITSVTYENRSNDTDIITFENAIIAEIAPEKSLIIKPRVRIFPDEILTEFEAGTVFVWPGGAYSAAVYGLGFPSCSDGNDDNNFSHSFSMDITWEKPVYLLSSGTKGYWEKDKTSGNFFLRYIYYWKSFSLSGRGTVSLSTTEGWNGSFWGEAGWAAAEHITFNLGFIAGGYKREDSRDFSGAETGVEGGMKYIFDTFKLGYNIQVTDNADYFTHSHSIFLDFML